MPKQLTIRGVPDEVGRRLEAISNERNQSVNATVVSILASAVGYSDRRGRLDRYVTWTSQDREEFESVLGEQRSVYDADWS